MKVTVETTARNTYEVVLRQDQQSFKLSYASSQKKDVMWYAKMFRIALRSHDEERERKA